MSGRKKERKTVEKIGTIVSDKMNKTRVVAVSYLSEHPLYGKKFLRRLKVMAHDENNMSQQGDTVRIVQCRPLSRKKRWFVAGIIQQAGSKNRTIAGESTYDSTENDSNSSR